MQRVIRSRVMTTIAVLAVTIGVAGCKSSGSSAAAKSQAGASQSSAATPSSPQSAGASAVASPVAASSGAVPDACKLITGADVAAVLGTPVDTPSDGFTGIYDICTYATAEDSAGGATSISITSRLIDKAGFEASIKQNTGEVAPLAGVCQDAYSSGSNVLAWKDGTEVDARIFGSPPGHDPVAEGTKLVTGACAKL